MLRRFWQRRRQRPFTCTDVDANVERVRDGRLSARETAAFKAHVAECDACRQRLKTEAAWLSTLQATPTPARLTPTERRAMQQALGRQMRRGMIMRNIRLSFQQVAVLGVLVLVVGGMVWWQTAVSPANESASLATSVQQQSTITFAGHSIDRSSYESLIQEFHEQYPNIVVQYVALEEMLGEGTASATMRQLASLADVVLLDGSPSTDANSYFLNLESFLAADTNFSPGELWPGLLSGCQVGNSQTGIPISVDASLIFFDSAIFATGGLPQPQPGWNWTDFQQAAQQLTQGTGAQKRYGFANNGSPIALLGPLVQQQTEVQTNLNVEQLDSQVGWYIDLVNSDVIFAGEPGTNRDVLLAQGKAAMWLGSSFELDRMREEVNDAVSVLPFPTSVNGDVENTTPLRPTCGMVSAGSRNPEAAWAWLHFLTRQTPQTARGSIPVRPSVADETGYWANWDEETVATLKFALANGWYGDFSSPMLTAVAESINQALASGRPLSEVLPATIALPSTVEPAVTDDTPVVVATPRATSTPVTVNVPDGELIVVEYYADLTVHHSQEAVEALASEFNEAQNRIQVQLFTNRPEFQGEYGIGEMAGAYDCFVWGGPATAYPQTIDRFYSLEALWAAEDTALRDDFYSGLMEQNRVAGELYGLPVASQPYVVYYNADRFDELGLERPSPDWTVNDFWTLATASTGEEGSQIYGFVPNIWSSTDLLLLAPQSPTLYNMDTAPPTVTFDDPDTIQALVWLDNMVDAGIMFPKEQTTQAQFQLQSSLINNGQAAMWIGLAGDNQYSFDVGIAPIPLTTAPLPSAGSVSAYISKRANTPTGCWEWLKFLSAHPDAFQGIPTRESILDSSEWIAVVSEERSATYQATLSRPVRTEPALDEPNLYVPFPFYVWWEEALQTTFAGGDPSTELSDIQVRAETYLQCIMAVETRDFDAVSNCAKQADPDFSPDF